MEWWFWGEKRAHDRLQRLVWVASSAFQNGYGNSSRLHTTGVHGSNMVHVNDE